MNGRRTAWLAWGLFVLAVLVHAAGVVFVIRGIGIPTPGDEDVNVGAVGFLIAFYAFPLVGAVIASRRPDNAIGWLFLGVGLLLALTNLAGSYADYAVFARPGTLPAGVWAAWAVPWLDPLFFFGVVLLLLVFPSGRLPSRRWRPVLWALVIAQLGVVLTSALEPGFVFEDSLPVENPAGIEAANGVREVVATVCGFVFVGSAITVVGGLILRFRRARGIERLQFKWLTLSACLLLVSFLSFSLVSIGLPERVAVGLVGLAFASIPIAVGAAVLRYRLYEIDRAISRALVYGSLTVVLGAAYVGLVLGGQWVTSSFAGGSDLAIAVSTLVVAALFLPVRARVQRVVDRRFYRRRYDAQRTLEAFAARLREQVELESLRVELRAVVEETMQPAHVGLWLREARG